MIEEEWIDWPETGVTVTDNYEAPRAGKKAKVEKPAHMGAYVFWASENRRSILSRYNLANGGDLRSQSAHLSAAWHSLTEGDRKLWGSRAQQFNTTAELEFARAHPDSNIDARKLQTQLNRMKREQGDLLAGIDISRYLSKQNAGRQGGQGAKQQGRNDQLWDPAATTRKRPAASAANSIAKLDDSFARGSNQRAAQLDAIRTQLDSTQIHDYALLDLAAMLRASANALARVGKSMVSQNLPAALTENLPVDAGSALDGTINQIVARAGTNASASQYDEAIDTLLSTTLCALSSLTCLANYAIPQRGVESKVQEIAAKTPEEDDAAHNAAFERIVEPETCCALLETVSYVLPDVAFAL